MRSLLLAIVLTACATANHQGPGAANASSGSGSDDVVCREVTDTGTMFSHTECTSAADRKDQRDDAQRWADKPRANTPPASSSSFGPGGGGGSHPK